MIKTLHQSPFLRLSLFYTAGIVFGTILELSPVFVLCVFSLSFILILSSFFCNSYNCRWVFGFALFLFLFSSGILSLKKENQKTKWENAGWQEYVGEIIDEPLKKPKTRMCLCRIDGKKVVLYITTDSLSIALQPGDSIRIRADLQEVDADYLKKKGIAARGFVSAWNWVKTGSSESFNLYYRSLAIRGKILETLQRIIPEEESYMVAAALLTGYKDDLTKELRQTFTATGSSHILAVSGFHFSAIYGMIYFFLSFLGKSRRSRIFIQIIILPIMWFYAFVTGMGASVIRAVTMLSLWGVGECFARRSFTLNTLGIAAFAMLLYNPLYLFDVGFQLSFAAVLSILLVNPYLVILYQSKNPALKYAWELCSVSTSAQIGTLPFCLFYFHQFPLLFMFTNLFAIPLSGILLFILPFSLFVHTLLPGFTLLNYLSNRFINLFLGGLRYVESVPNGLIERLNFSFLDSFLMTLYLIIFVLFLIKKRIFYLCLGILFVTVQVLHYFCFS